MDQPVAVRSLNKTERRLCVTAACPDLLAPLRKCFSSYTQNQTADCVQNRTTGWINVAASLRRTNRGGGGGEDDVGGGEETEWPRSSQITGAGRTAGHNLDSVLTPEAVFVNDTCVCTGDISVVTLLNCRGSPGAKTPLSHCAAFTLISV